MNYCRPKGLTLSAITDASPDALDMLTVECSKCHQRYTIDDFPDHCALCDGCGDDIASGSLVEGDSDSDNDSDSSVHIGVGYGTYTTATMVLQRTAALFAHR